MGDLSVVAVDMSYLYENQILATSQLFQQFSLAHFISDSEQCLPGIYWLMCQVRLMQ